MKILLTTILAGLVLTAVACTPNRLQKAIQTPQPDAPSVAAPTPSGRNLQPQLGNANIDLDEVATLLPPDAIPAIMPEDVPAMLVTAAEADAAGMEPSTRVLGVSINGESRAYPIPFMSGHEIVNDAVGGRLIAATW